MNSRRLLKNIVLATKTEEMVVMMFVILIRAENVVAETGAMSLREKGVEGHTPPFPCPAEVAVALPL